MRLWDWPEGNLSKFWKRGGGGLNTALDAAVAAYLEHRRRRHLASGTLVGDRYALGRWLTFCRRLRLADPAAITPEHVEAFGAYLARTYRTRGTRPGRLLPPRTIAETMHAVRAFFRFLVREDVLLLDPARGLEIRGQRALLLDHVLSLADFEALVATLDVSSPRGLRNRAMLEVLYGCGLRAAELVALDTTDLDLTGGLVIVRHGKGGRSRIVPVAGVARRWLARYVVSGRVQLITTRSDSAAFLATSGRRLSTATLRLVIHDAARRVRLAHPVTPHWFRHGFATALLRGGADVSIVQRLLGHARIDTTEHYTPVSVEDLVEVHRRTHPRERRS